MRWYLKPLWFAWLFICGMLSILRTALFSACIAAVAVLSLYGAAAIYDVFQDARLPPVMALSCPIASTARPSRGKLSEMSRVEKWQSMQPALAILDRVCPPISEWVRGKWQSGQLVFVTPQTGYYAAYMPVGGLLLISIEGLVQSDVHLACTLAHEFRHSRQPILPLMQSRIAELCGLGEARRNRIEEEAYEFEARVWRAIKGIP